ncbi:Asp23/Gls24 family envelope stress response protein [Citricoccus sp.]|uniref:Asp23/Gls24 family envelope stress response protein n=1 Tax=Citricoccus sp. TaxID=1978372 RepID=UPI0028BD21BE|nr:Asp23/Gls24 family envelope stress response protein [Citricoccus sp.]
MAATDERAEPGAAAATAAPAATRGSTSVPAKVVARIAEQAAFEMPGVGSAAGGVLGIGARREFEGRPSAEAEIYGVTVVLRLDVGLAFPAPLGPALAGLREHVGSQVESLTGLAVGRMEIDVSWLHTAGITRRELL